MGNKRESAKAFVPNKKYTHYQVNKKTGKIHDGWQYSKGLDKESINEYYENDLRDNDCKKKDFKLTKKKDLKVDPQNWDNWYKPVL